MEWRAILRGELQNRVLDLAQQVAGRILCEDGTHQSDSGNENTAENRSGDRRWIPFTIANGNSGLAILCGYFDDCFPGAGWGIFGKRELELAASSASVASSMPLGLHAGLSGLAYAASYLSCGGRRYSKFLQELEGELFPLVEAESERVGKERGGLSSSEYDVIAGLSGIGAYLMSREEDSTAKRLLEKILLTLIELTKEENGFPRWHTPGGQIEGKLAERFADGLLDCGMAHGMPGILALMCHAANNGIEVQGLLSAISAQKLWLLDYAAYDDWGMNWPAAVPLDCVRRGEDHDRSTYFLKEKPTKTAWCYGAPGVACALWLAGKVTGDHDCCRRAVGAMKSALAKPVRKRYLGSSPTFCHGLAGLLHITTHFAVNTGELEFEEAAERLTCEIIAQYDPASAYGFRNVDFGEIEHDDAGVLEGAAGVVLSLLAAAVDVHPRWSRIFALA